MCRASCVTTLRSLRTHTLTANGVRSTNTFFPADEPRALELCSRSGTERGAKANKAGLLARSRRSCSSYVCVEASHAPNADDDADSDTQFFFSEVRGLARPNLFIRLSFSLCQFYSHTPPLDRSGLKNADPGP
ncbi:unnamed protein product, partial [Ectocarpus sp. 13 AM-2016]